MTRQTSGAVDLEGVERRVATARRVIDSLTKEFPERSEVIRAPCYLAALAVDCLALIARVRELELAHNGIYRDGYAAGAAEARKRCAEVARSVADEMDGRETHATRVGKAIAAAIKRGDA